MAALSMGVWVRATVLFYVDSAETEEEALKQMEDIASLCPYVTGYPGQRAQLIDIIAKEPKTPTEIANDRVREEVRRRK